MPDLDHTNALAEDRTELALLRTLQANDRTLLAWMRTTLGMIAFGFGFYKFHQLSSPSGTGIGVLTTEGLALGLVGLGTALISGALLQYLQVRGRLVRQGNGGASFSLALYGALAILLCGGVAFLDLLISMLG